MNKFLIIIVIVSLLVLSGCNHSPRNMGEDVMYCDTVNNITTCKTTNIYCGYCNIAEQNNCVRFIEEIKER